MADEREWQVRAATETDIALLAEFRRRMFTDLDRSAERIDAMAAAFVPYAYETMPRGELLGWIAEVDATPIGGVAVVLQRNPPSVRNPRGTVGYILNMYVVPEFRRRGVARGLVETAVATLRERGVGGVTLHASEQGRPLYEQLGFKPSSEMRLFFDENV